MADATIDGLREVLEESLGELRKGVAGLSVEQLNARPAGGDTNPIAVIVTHALGSTRSWLSLAMGASMPDRDRPAEFRAVAGDGFDAWTEDGTASCLALLDGATWDPARVGVANWTKSQETRTAAYAASHALSHLGEHVGHLHMTLELLRDGG
ncbi:MAG TPA: DinB family protein [Actinomycetota bacterium]|nr:DinB family protein [Actinomycetota bacterium]